MKKKTRERLTYVLATIMLVIFIMGFIPMIF